MLGIVLTAVVAIQLTAMVWLWRQIRFYRIVTT